MLFPLVFLWLVFVGGTVGEADDDEDETEVGLVSSQINKIASPKCFFFLILTTHKLTKVDFLITVSLHYRISRLQE